MPQVLKLHPNSSTSGVRGIAAHADRAAERLALRFRVTGEVAGLVTPAPSAPVRTDELWRHTCFEAFVQGPASAAYYEFNLAPSTQWAAYRFDGYRSGMEAAEALAP